jgi:hypothetical protein
LQERDEVGAMENATKLWAPSLSRNTPTEFATFAPFVCPNRRI